MRIVLVRSGTAYTPDYVERLPEAVTLTDQDDTPGETRPLTKGWPGWWSKLELFAPEHDDLRPFLFMDLDNLVLGNFDHLCGGDEFRMVADFTGWTYANSSVMWVPKDVSRIWETFIVDPERHMTLAGSRGDQHFLGQFCEHLWEPVASGITSYKRHGKDGPVGCIMQFHGRPKPHEVKDGWVREHWRTGKTWASTGAIQ